MRLSALGYTLVELLVVISIVALVSVLVFVNSKEFTQDQLLIKASDQLQSALRLAQTNAQTGTVCGTQEGSIWLISLTSDSFYLEHDSGDCDKTYQLEGVTISKITASDCGGSSLTSLSIKYQPLAGNAVFQNADSCVASSRNVEIILKNAKNNKEKKVKVSKGGTIDVEK